MQLGLRPGDEDPGPDGEVDEAERRGAGEVLQRHPGGPLLDQRGEPRGGVVGDVDQGQQPGAGHAEHGGQQQLGVHPRRLDAGLGQPARGVAEQGAGVQDPAASSSAVCAAVSASSTGSSSPSRTASRLCALKPTRWSEIRFSGKL